MKNPSFYQLDCNFIAIPFLFEDFQSFTFQTI